MHCSRNVLAALLLGSIGCYAGGSPTKSTGVHSIAGSSGASSGTGVQTGGPTGEPKARMPPQSTGGSTTTAVGSTTTTPTNSSTTEGTTPPSTQTSFEPSPEGGTDESGESGEPVESTGGLLSGEPIPGAFIERDGMVVGEAENAQSLVMGTMEQSWELFTDDLAPTVQPDRDASHVSNASGMAYIEALPDIKVEHGGTNANRGLQERGGVGPTARYTVTIEQPGLYRVWVRMFYNGTESNSVHVGLDGQWPASGARVEACFRNPTCNDITAESCNYYRQGGGEDGWHWVKTRRYPHHGCYGLEDEMAALLIEEPGEHTLSISMREDGVEVDKWLLTRDLAFVPDGAGPPPTPATE